MPGPCVGAVIVSWRVRFMFLISDWSVDWRTVCDRPPDNIEAMI